MSTVDYRIADKSIPPNKRKYFYYAEFKCQPDWPKDKTVRKRTAAVTCNSQVRAEELIQKGLAKLHPFAIKVGHRHG